MVWFTMTKIKSNLTYKYRPMIHVYFFMACCSLETSVPPYYYPETRGIRQSRCCRNDLTYLWEFVDACLRESDTEVYRVDHNTGVSLINHSYSQRDGVSQSESDLTAQSVRLAGVDEILSTLTRLIIHPITQRSSYHKYGTQLTRFMFD